MEKKSKEEEVDINRMLLEQIVEACNHVDGDLHGVIGFWELSGIISLADTWLTADTEYHRQYVRRELGLEPYPNWDEEE